VRITHLEHRAVCVPFVPGVLPSSEFARDYNASRPEPLEKRRHNIVRIHTDDGLTGIGMSDPYFGDRGGLAPEMPLIGRDPLDFDPRQLRGGGSGYGVALLDLIGKAIGWPVYRIFGGRFQDRILVNYWITRLGPEASAAAAKRAAALGFRAIKLKCAPEDGNVAERVHAIHEAAPGLRIVLDAKCRFHTVKQTLALTREIDTFDVVLEDPIPKDNPENYRRLKEATRVLVVQELQTPQQVFEAICARAVDGINVSPSGWAFLDMARIAQVADIPVWQASDVDLGVLDAFRAHVSTAAPNCTLGSDLCGNFVHEHSLLTRSLVADGYAVVSDAPGLGFVQKLLVHFLIVLCG